MRVSKEYFVLHPKDALMLAELGTVYFQVKQYDNAIDALEKAVGVDSKLSAALHTLGSAYKQVGRNEDALSAWQRVLDNDPGYSERNKVWTLKAALLVQLGHLSEALREADNEVRLNPENAYAFFVRGEVHQVLNNPQDSINDLIQALALEKAPAQRAVIYLGMARAYWQISRSTDALEMLNKVLELKRFLPYDDHLILL
jgi:tetratricopeptide (TPR) repeat protein